MNTSRSELWKYYTKLSKETVKCNICFKTLKSSGNTSNLHAHLKQKHSIVYKQLRQSSTSPLAQTKPKLAKIDLEPSIPNTTKVLKIVSNSDGQESSVQESSQPEAIASISNISDCKTVESSLKQGIQPSIKESIQSVCAFSDGGSKNVRITNAVVKFIYKDNMPFSTVEGKGFLNLMKEVCPLYKVPTRNTIKNAIDKKYETASLTFSKLLNNVKNITLTTDMWTDTCTKSFIGVTVHFLQNTNINSAILDVIELDEAHTADYISSMLLEVLKKWNIPSDKIVAVVTDNGANIVKAIHDTFGKNKHVPCFAHTINLVCENAMKKTENLNALLEKVVAIVVWFKRSVHAIDQLRKIQKESGVPEGNIKKLIMEVKTRWNSSFYMLQRFLEMAPLITKIIFDNVNAPEMLSAIQLENLREIVKLLEPLETITREISGDKYVTLSKIIPIVACVVNEYKNTNVQFVSPISKCLRTELIKEFEKRFGTIERSFLLATATILDPRFKNIHFKDTIAASTIINFFKNELTISQHGDSTDTDSSTEVESSFDLWSYHKKIAHTRKTKKGNIKLDEVSHYLSIPVRTLKEDPLVSWEEMKHIFPHLHKLAEKFLPIVGTSVPCERLFSKAGLTATKSRNRLTGKRLAKLLFLQSISDELVA